MVVPASMKNCIFVCYNPIEFINASPIGCQSQMTRDCSLGIRHKSWGTVCKNSFQGDASDWSGLEGDGRGVLQLPQSLGKTAVAPSIC